MHKDPLLTEVTFCVTSRENETSCEVEFSFVLSTKLVEEMQRNRSIVRPTVGRRTNDQRIFDEKLDQNEFSLVDSSGKVFSVGELKNEWRSRLDEANETDLTTTGFSRLSAFAQR